MPAIPYHFHHAGSHPWNGLTAVSGVATRKACGLRPSYYTLGYTMPYAPVHFWFHWFFTAYFFIIFSHLKFITSLFYTTHISSRWNKTQKNISIKLVLLVGVQWLFVYYTVFSLPMYNFSFWSLVTRYWWMFTPFILVGNRILMWDEDYCTIWFIFYDQISLII